MPYHRAPVALDVVAMRAPYGDRQQDQGTKIDSRWIGLQGPHNRIWWTQNELIATTAISATQSHPSAR